MTRVRGGVDTPNHPIFSHLGGELYYLHIDRMQSGVRPTLYAQESPSERFGLGDEKQDSGGMTLIIRVHVQESSHSSIRYLKSTSLIELWSENASLDPEDQTEDDSKAWKQAPYQNKTSIARQLYEYHYQNAIRDGQ